MATKLDTAFKASGIRVNDACAILGVTAPTLNKYREDPSKLRFGQFFALAKEMEGDARRIMRDVPAEVEVGAEIKPLDELTLGEFYAAKRGLGPMEAELDGLFKEVFA